MAYATVLHVQSLNPGRVIGATSKPSATQAVQFLTETAAELDSILKEKGYAVPVASTATGSWNLLEGFNALGGYARVEAAAQTSDRRDTSAAMWENAKKMLLDGVIELPDAPVDATVALPRSSLGSTGDYATPFFTRDMLT